GLLAMSKTYTFCLILMVFFYAALSLPHFLRRPRINIFYFMLVTFAIGAGYYFYQDNRLMHDQIEALVSMNYMDTFGSRIGDEGYLVTSGTIAAMLKPAAFLLGMGGGVSDYAWTDNGYFQVLMYGGLGFFMVFYGYVAYLMFLISRTANEIGSRLMLALY